jgi:hypothetical protein
MGDQVEKARMHNSHYTQSHNVTWFTNAHTSLQAEMGVYPFMFGTTKDFQPIVDELVKV